MSSYILIDDIKQLFRFFEIRSWNEDEVYYTNEYFKFNIKRNHLGALGFTYSAHINLWLSGCQNNFTETKYGITKFTKGILYQFDLNEITNDPPCFGYDDKSLGITALMWDYPKFEITNINEAGVYCLDEDNYEYYFDLVTSDLCTIDDFKHSNKILKNGSIVEINPGDPVFMDDKSYSFINKDLTKKINKLNMIYSKVGFPHKIKML
jgi:hypothetical protein